MNLNRERVKMKFFWLLCVVCQIIFLGGGRKTFSILCLRDCKSEDFAIKCKNEMFKSSKRTFHSMFFRRKNKDPLNISKDIEDKSCLSTIGQHLRVDQEFMRQQVLKVSGFITSRFPLVTRILVEFWPFLAYFLT